MGIWKSHDKAQAKSLDDRGSVGYLLDIDIWQISTTRIMQDGIVVKGIAAKRLDPARYHLNPRTDLNWAPRLPGKRRNRGRALKKPFAASSLCCDNSSTLPRKSSVGHATGLLLTQRQQFKALEDCEACSKTGLLISQGASAFVALIASGSAQS